MQQQVTVSLGCWGIPCGCRWLRLAAAGAWKLPVSPAPLTSETFGLDSSFFASSILLACTAVRPVVPDALPRAPAPFLWCS